MSAMRELIEDSGAAVIRVALVLLFVASVAFILYSANWRTIAGLDASSVWTYRIPILKGFAVTLGLTVVAAVFGIVSGTILAITAQSTVAPLRWVVAVHVEFFRNTPLIVQLMWIHFALPVLTGYNLSPVQSGVIAIALQASAYFTELVRAGIAAVPRSQWDAAYALGLPARTRWTRVILPPAIRMILPLLANLTISFFKATAIVSVLQVGEMMGVATRIANATFRPVEVLSAVALIYIIAGFGMSRLSLRLERALARSGAEGR